MKLNAVVIRNYSGVVWLFALPLFASASTDVTFWNSSVNNRLNQIEVRSAVQDGSGALWFATQEGLTRYNGIRADTFSAANAEAGGLRPGEVRSLTVSARGHLWVLTSAIQTFDPETQEFAPLSLLDKKYAPVSLATDQNGLVWIGLDGAVGLYRPNTESLEILKLPTTTLPGKDDRSVTSPIQHLIPNGDHAVGVSPTAVFELKITSTGEIIATPIANLASAISSTVITAAIFDSFLYLGTGVDGLIVVDLESRSIRQITQGPDDIDLPSDTITTRYGFQLK